MASVTIHKYPLPLDADDFTIDMPGHVRLSLDVQRGIPCIWAAVPVDPEANKPYPHRFVWVGTGQTIPESVKSYGPTDFVGTVLLRDGELVLHLFRVWP